MKKISILGSTGSIGVNALDVISKHPDKFQVVGLAAGENDSLLQAQIEKFKPRIAALFNEKHSDKLKKKIKDKNVKIASGIDGVLEVATIKDADMIISAIVGAAGLIPTISAIKAGKDIALEHPNWSMGTKITIDSATLINKGFEVIEARWLFGMADENIEVLIHPQSIIHSLVEFIDGSIIAQLGIPDMRIPISYALNYPDR